MSNMTKKVGRAVIESLCGRRGFDDLFDSIEKRDMLEIVHEVGEAAIKAMRNPTEAMVEAGANVDEWCQSEGQAAQPDVYRAMIDEALK